MMKRRVAGGSKIKLTSGNFLLNNGRGISPININDSNRNDVIGYILDDSGGFSGRYTIVSINSSAYEMTWSSELGPGYTDIPGLTNYQYSDESTEPYKDKIGKLNTKIIVDYINYNSGTLSSDVPATYYCTSYSPGFKNGEWYLPSAGELKLFYDNRTQFRSDCNTSGISTNMNSDYGGHYYFWSSTEVSGSSAWSLGFSSSKPSCNRFKGNARYVVPFLSID